MASTECDATTAIELAGIRISVTPETPDPSRPPSLMQSRSSSSEDHSSRRSHIWDRSLQCVDVDQEKETLPPRPSCLRLKPMIYITPNSPCSPRYSSLSRTTTMAVWKQ
ncbi:hypothetical protein CAPTEDRAFT_210423 [Capitella teleta]|uniref:Uncharacterized protein n=1 Tax=Capitella teleta TaxID=283909 RepID=N1PBF0_CAPTE|nr:hypothetical protein CAPTEDRAFT_210423 [Capitella teleta]|eukprot:ELU18939.1 hypothetical protein CAPTEDRAFT_210423 [Capitella teleta]